MTHHLFWFRQDLRIADNTALLAACENPQVPVSAVYLLTPRQWAAHDVAATRIDFEYRQLQVLQTALSALNIPLHVLDAGDFAGVPNVLLSLMQRLGCQRLFANRQHEVNELDRDAAVTTLLARHDLTSHWHDDLCVLPPGTLLTGQGKPYTVFTPFKRNWLQQLDQPGLRPRGLPAARTGAAGAVEPWPDNPAGDERLPGRTALHLWPVGEAEAHRRLQQFLQEDLHSYRQRRDLPAINGTSTLSPYLAAGLLSARQCLHGARQQIITSGGSDGGEHWISELCWRDFYKHILFHFPHVCRGRAFQRETDRLPWRQDSDLFAAWCEGRTGYPIVDAAMRQLRQTGWMHNRLRMITAMFLSKDLFIDWRWGEQHFMRHLIDGDFSANNGGWQWSASTGNDAAPYFRIFNPALQSQRCDPDGEFIRRFVPELAHLPTAHIHEPWAKGRAGAPGYPRPVVDHNEARQHTLAAFKSLSAS